MKHCVLDNVGKIPLEFAGWDYQDTKIIESLNQ